MDYLLNSGIRPQGGGNNPNLAGMIGLDESPLVHDDNDLGSSDLDIELSLTNPSLANAAKFGY